MAHRFKEYQPLKGGIPERQNGSLVSMENGTAIPYSIDKLQDRGKFFVDPRNSKLTFNPCLLRYNKME